MTMMSLLEFLEKVVSMEKKICIITGANAGIGEAAAGQVGAAGHHVILACRSKERGESALRKLRSNNIHISAEVMILDMSLQSSIHRFVRAFKAKYDHLDILIHNAAYFDISQKQAIKTTEGIEQVWATNHLGPVLLTNLLLGYLMASPNGRILTIASKGLVIMRHTKVDLEDPEFETRRFSVPKAYYQSKCAQIIYTYWLAKKLKETSITVNCIRVTNVKIDISRYPNISRFNKWLYKQKSKKSITPEVMAKTYTFLALDPRFERVTGRYFNEHNEEVKSSAYTYSEDEAEKVMKLTFSYFKEGAEENA